MKLQFDANQQFQLDAVAAVADLFDGQPEGAPEYAIINLGSLGGLFDGQESTELGVGNRLLLAPEQLRENTRAVQARNEVGVLDEQTALEAWDVFDVPANQPRECPHFSVEMETGTGKTYVYLRTIFELSRRYGFQKFVIVVPSVAIREGVLKNIQITKEHFRALYNNLAFEHFVYDAKKANRLRQFATSNTLQILIINIDAFRKNFTGTEEEQKSNVIYKESDKLSGRQPIEFVQATRPIVIIDEPQSVDSTDKSQEAIRALNPLCTLRYSATHRNPYNLVYRLDPIRAFELRLVKQIVVASAIADGSAGGAFVRVESITHNPALKARLRIQVQGKSGPKDKTVTAKQGTDLFVASNERESYRSGFEVTEINATPAGEYIEFANDVRLAIGEEVGGMREDVWRAQIKHTIKQHLEKELELRARGIKVLSLFFVDRVANYRDYDEHGQPVAGKYAKVFEEELADLKGKAQYKDINWLDEPFGRLHNGYFAQDKKGVLKDTTGNTQADDEVYNLIMKDKERLLSLTEPLRFIFSHSALREGWDNPNVFQICTLNETKSAIKKRQEIGRGLRLPVDQDGRRVFDESVNRLYVMANESYEDFAKALQTEYEEDCGVTFGKVPMTSLAMLIRAVDGREEPLGPQGAAVVNAFLVANGVLDDVGRIQPMFDPKAEGFELEMPEGFEDFAPAVIDLLASYQLERHVKRARDERKNHLKKAVVLDPEFRALWERIKLRTTFRVEFSTEELTQKAVDAIKKMPRTKALKIRIEAGKIDVKKGGVESYTVASSTEAPATKLRTLPDILAYLQNETELTRSTIFEILKQSGRLDDFFDNPQEFMDTVARILKSELHRLLVDGIKYEKIQGIHGDAEWEMALFNDEEIVNYLSALQVNHSIYEFVEYQSEVERRFAEALDKREDVKLFVKLPNWFKIDTPVGTYNPDWAIVKHHDDTLYLVRETKATKDFLKLRNSEADKVRCGKRHFEAIGVDFDVVVSASEV
jgi:type III restriction enzyme